MPRVVIHMPRLTRWGQVVTVVGVRYTVFIWVTVFSMVPLMFLLMCHNLAMLDPFFSNMVWHMGARS